MEEVANSTTGRVGINTTAPTASLEVAVASGSAGTTLRVMPAGDVVIRLGFLRCSY